jgi:Uma2 family endonuclease
MSTATTAAMTIDEFMAKHGGETYVDLVNGRVEYQPMPHRSHGLICNTASFVLTAFVRERDLGRVFSCDTFVLIRKDPPTLRGADVMFISYDRLPRGRIPENALEPAPELVVEVRPPSERLSAVTTKAEEYIAAGVMVVVYLDPANESAAVYRGQEFPVRLHNSDELTIPDILPGFSVPVKRFFE